MKICLIGDSCIDQIVTGTCERMSPEAPVPVLSIEYIDTKDGMAANVLANLQAFGLDVDFFTNEEEIYKTRFVDSKSGQHLMRADIDTEASKFNDIVDYDKYDCVVISDYAKGFVGYDTVEHILDVYDGPIFIDTKKTDLKRFEGCYIKINDLEYTRATSLPAGGVIVTQGSKGALWNGKTYPAPQVDVFDVCGAGDTFLAAVVYEFLTCGSIDQAIKFANQCAAITVQHLGVYSLKKDDIEALCKS
jgi:bifunctional ADP-heptose synthase (sugar kinase/adenylyltransferase)